MHVWNEQISQCYPELMDGVGGALDMVFVKAHDTSKMTEQDLKGIRRTETLRYGNNGQTPIPSSVSPRLVNSKYVALTTAHSLEERVLKVLEKKISWEEQPEGIRKQNSRGDWYTTNPRPIKRNKNSFPTTVVAHLARDEFHLEKNKGSKTISRILHLRKWQLRKRWSRIL
jgi:hypothetical protein